MREMTDDPHRVGNKVSPRRMNMTRKNNLLGHCRQKPVYLLESPINHTKPPTFYICHLLKLCFSALTWQPLCYLNGKP